MGYVPMEYTAEFGHRRAEYEDYDAFLAECREDDDDDEDYYDEHGDYWRE